MSQKLTEIDSYFAGDATRNGTYAEYVAIDERIAAHAPKK